jgi:hypothetical protein
MVEANIESQQMNSSVENLRNFQEADFHFGMVRHAY